jgi:hypothetical protein
MWTAEIVPAPFFHRGCERLRRINARYAKGVLSGQRMSIQYEDMNQALSRTSEKIGSSACCRRRVEFDGWDWVASISARTIAEFGVVQSAAHCLRLHRRVFVHNGGGNNSPDVAYQSCSAGSRSCRQQSVVSWRSVCQSHSGVRCPLRG